MTKIRPETLEQIKLLMRRDLKLGSDITIPDDMPFAGTEADFDSLDILLLMGSIEKHFNIKIPSEAVGREVFRNLSTLTDYVQEQIAGTGSARNADPMQRLPHRAPFLFLSRITKIEEGRQGEGIWVVKGDEPLFAGHFPGRPLVPGVLITEALAQLSGLVAPVQGGEGKLVHVDLRFDQSVAPPAEIVLHSRLLRGIGELYQFEVSASAGSSTVARGMLTLSRPSQPRGGA